MRIRKLPGSLLACLCLPAGAECMDEALYEEYEALCSRLLERCSGPENAAEFAALPRETQQLCIVADFDMEIQNGGICQYFANCGQNSAALVSQSLRAIGLEPLAQLYDSFLLAQKIDPEDLSGFECDSVEEFAAIYAGYPESDAFDEAYMELRTELEFSRTMLEYAKAHLN